MSYVWYVGYGSNLHRQRFECYIVGKRPQFAVRGAKRAAGCHDKSRPIADKSIEINYPLYFAIPDKGTCTSNWGPGGVAFLDPQSDPKTTTYCRMWKITDKQYTEVRKQEGQKWYNLEIRLGTECGDPILTITNRSVIANMLPPSDAYLKTIALGLREAYQFSDDEIADYLLSKGISGALGKKYILNIMK
jgi:hypothetical protein